MSKLATPISSSARRWRVAFSAIEVIGPILPILSILAAGQFGCQRQFSPPPPPGGGQGNGSGTYSNGGSNGNSGGGGIIGGGVGGYYPDGGVRGIGGNYGAGGYYGLGGMRGGLPCLGGYPSCWPINPSCYINDPYPAICDSTTGQWGCPPGFTTYRQPISCADGGAGGMQGVGGMQCEMLPTLGTGGMSGAGGAIVRDAGASDGGASSDGGVSDAGTGDAGTGDAGTGGAPARPTPSFASAISYPSGGRPVQVAVADMDGDGHPDIVVTSRINGISNFMWQVNVLLNVGDGTFSAPVSYSVPGTVSPYLAVGDLNGDGKPDVATTNDSGADLGPFYVVILLNQGNGKLAAPIQNFIAGSPRGLALADVNGDGRIEVVAAYAQYPIAGGVAVLSNLGGGVFGAARTFSAGSQPNGVVAGDLNHDGQVDLAVVNYASESPGVNGNLSVLLNQGGGTFAPPVSYPAGDFLTAVAEADLNGDGQPDLAVLDSVSEVNVLLNEGSGTFVGPLRFSAQHASTAFTLGDVTGDGRVDIVSSVPLSYGFSGWTYGDVSVLVNGGGGIFSRVVDIPDEPIDGAVALGDFNGDGKLDVVAVNHTYNCSDSVSVLLNTSP